MTGFSTFFIDIAMGILTILFNRQIMAYLGTNALAVYGVIVNVSTLVQCCAYSIGQASQPIFSTYYFQAVLKPRAAFVVSVSRGLVVSGIFIYERLRQLIRRPESFSDNKRVREAWQRLFICTGFIKRPVC